VHFLQTIFRNTANFLLIDLEKEYNEILEEIMKYIEVNNLYVKPEKYM